MKLYTSLLSSAFFAAALVLSQVGSAAEADPSLDKGLRGLHLGNSLTDHMTGISGFAESKGYAHSLMNFTAPGVPIWMVWAKYIDSGKDFLDTETFDVISIQPFGRKKLDDDLIPANKIFAKASRQNPLAQMYVLAQWPPKKPNRKTKQLPIWDEVINAEPGENEDMQLWFEKGSFYAYRHLADEISHTFPNHRRCLVIPMLAAVNELKNRIDAGDAPGFSSIWQIYEDGVHFKSMGRYLQVVTAFATYYREKPHDGSRLYSFWRGPGGVSKEFATLAWDCAWKAVTDNWRYSGVREDGPAFLTGNLPNAWVSKPYFKALSVAGLGLTYRYSTDSLPPGLHLDTDTGVISGIPEKSGSYTLAMSVDDADPDTPPATENFTLAIAEPPPPAIGDSQQLPPAIAGIPYEVQIQRTGGYGTLTWALTKAPSGFDLDSDGLLTGQASSPGNYTLAITATDSKGQTATASLKLSVLTARKPGIVCEIYNQKFEQADDYKVMSREGYQILDAVSLDAKEREEDFGMRFLFDLNITQAGSYKFMVRVDDAACLRINGTEIITNTKGPVGKKNKKKPSPRWGYSDPIELNQGLNHVELIYWQRSESAYLNLGWTPPGSASYTDIPTNLCFQPNDQQGAAK